MSKSNFMGVIVPLSPIMQNMIDNEETQQSARFMIWSSAAKELRALLDHRFSCLAPAVNPWGKSAALPYGVALGALEREVFLDLYLTARELQEQEIQDRNAAIRSKLKPLFIRELSPEVTVTLAALPHDDPELEQELERGQKFLSGDITGAAVLYYLGYKSNYLTDQQENDLLAHMDKFALCVAELSPAGKE